GSSHGPSRTLFDTMRDKQIDQKDPILGPFESDEEWELAKWLVKNTGHKQAEQFLKLPIIQDRVSPSFMTKDMLLDAIDDLPRGVGWTYQQVTMHGDVEDDAGKCMTEEVELWYRDPVEVVRELMGNPMFRDVMKYAPEQVFRDEERDEQVVNEMWTASWWWELQRRLPKGATIAPLILSSDKTRLSQFRGDKSAWPVYLTIGNISKEIRRQASSHATVLIGYIPVGKFTCFSDKTRQVARYRLFHHCMSIILDSVAKAGKDGVDMACADRELRRVWPILAAYVADYPEQCLIACCMENRCPICKVSPNARGDHIPTYARDTHETASMLAAHARGQNDSDFKRDFQELGLRAICAPFWTHLPHTDIFQAFTPDLLHQLHKGVFKDHLVKWCTALLGKKELDERFRAMSSHPGLRHFKNGISSVSQWTGTEHKEMEKVFIGILASSDVDKRVVKAASSILDFIYFASLQSHTTSTLAHLREALDTFHANKSVFIELEARYPEHFNIPKIHSMEHYFALIWRFGSADGYNTESPERLHIDYAKDAYRASNKKDYAYQMTVWLERQESVDRFQSYLDWCRFGYVSTHRTALATYQLSSRPTTKSLSTDLDVESEDDAVVVDHLAKGAPAHLYKIAKAHPPGLRSVPAGDIITGHKASRFLAALSTFLRDNGGHVNPTIFDNFDLWKRIELRLPTIPEAGSRSLKNIVRASPPVPAKGRRQPEPAHLDFALIRTAELNDKIQGSTLEGLRVGHVRVIFKLPDIYRIRCAHPLAYIEWFTPFGAHNDPASDLYPVTRSTRMRLPYAEVIEVDRIVRNCHLIPKFGRVKQPSWTAENVIE
ncbi:hypothetical protein FIBSPDRAFT_666170, partial [Athelia psychrophila]